VNLPFAYSPNVTPIPAEPRCFVSATLGLDPAHPLEDKHVMHFLKTLFWVILALIAVIFSLRNWHPVSINLWAGITADVKLPALMVLSMLIGFLPTYAVHRTKLWRLKRRIDNLERNAPLAEPPAPVLEPAEPLPGTAL